jgi:cation transport ATPase
MVSSLGKAARAGILVRGGDVFERLSTVGTLVLDKTGTVTMGAMTVVRTRGDRRAIALAANLERLSAHPVAKAISALNIDRDVVVTESLFVWAMRHMTAPRSLIVPRARCLGAVSREWCAAKWCLLVAQSF